MLAPQESARQKKVSVAVRALFVAASVWCLLVFESRLFSYLYVTLHFNAHVVCLSGGRVVVGVWYV